MTKLGPPPDDVEGLLRENKMLRAELHKRIKSEKRAVEIKTRALKTSGSLLFTLFDRKKIITNFIRLFDTIARFSGAQENWPSRDEIIADAKAVSLSWVRFAVRRRTLMFLISLAAFFIPAIQIYLVLQQNEIIENQNKYFEIQVYDIVARSMTSGDMSAKQMTGALLARSDLPFLSGLVGEVFGSDYAEALYETDADAATRRLKEAAFRGHLILGLARTIDVHGRTLGSGELHEQVQPMFAQVMRDATWRVPELLRFSRSTVNDDPDLTPEVYRYLFNLGTLMRKQWSLALAADKEGSYFNTLAPLVARSSRQRVSAFVERGPLSSFFFERALRELLVDLTLEPEFGEPPPAVPSDAGAIDKLVRQGFDRLKTGIGEGRGVEWQNLKKLAEVP